MGLPMVLINAVAGCEEHNMEFFTERGGAVTADTPEALADAAITLLHDRARLDAMRRALKRDGDCTPAECMYNTIYNTIIK